MTKNKKILLGWLSCIPILWAWGGAFYTLLTINDNTPPPSFNGFALYFLTQLLVLGLLFGLMIYYITLIDNNKNMDKSTAIKWIASLVLFQIIAVPIYWYLQIWLEPTKKHE